MSAYFCPLRHTFSFDLMVLATDFFDDVEMLGSEQYRVLRSFTVKLEQPDWSSKFIRCFEEHVIKTYRPDRHALVIPENRDTSGSREDGQVVIEREAGRVRTPHREVVTSYAIAKGQQVLIGNRMIELMRFIGV